VTLFLSRAYGTLSSLSVFTIHTFSNSTGSLGAPTEQSSAAEKEMKVAIEQLKHGKAVTANSIHVGTARSDGGRSRSLAHVSGTTFHLMLHLLRRWLSLDGA